MTVSSKPHLSYEAQVRLPTPDEAMNKAYAVHAASDPDLEGTLTQELAKQIAQQILGLKPRRGDLAERAYIDDALKPTIHSYARSLYQNKKKWMQRSLEAAENHRIQLARLNSGFLSAQGTGILFTTIRPFLLPAIFAFFTSIFAAILGQYLPEKAASAADPNFVLIGLTAIGALLGRILSVRLRISALERIKKERDGRLDLVEEVYHRSKKKEYERGYKNLCVAWKQYTGRPYKKVITFQEVLDGELIFKEKLKALMADLDKPWHAKAKDAARDLRASLNELRQKKPLDMTTPEGV